MPAANSTIRAATATDLDHLGGQLAAAFHDDPVFGWLMPQARRRPAQLRRVFGTELRHVVMPRGTVWMTGRGEGALLELPPGAWRLPLRAQVTHAPAFTRTFGRRLPHALALITRMERRHLREPHIYVAYIGVAPEAQGQGVGGALLGHTIERAGRLGLPAYLEASSARSAALYERLGFRHLGKLTLGDSPPLWLMRREARTSSSAEAGPVAAPIRQAAQSSDRGRPR